MDMTKDTPLQRKMEAKIREDLVLRNVRAGFEMFRFDGIRKEGPYWEIDYLYRPAQAIAFRKMTYGGYPFLSRLGVMKSYLEDCREG